MPESDQPIVPIQESLSPELIGFQASLHAGPLPSPSVLADYERLVPGSAERIIVQFEEQSRHRRDLESLTVKTNSTAQLRGQVIGGVLALAAMLASIILVAQGLVWQGVVLIVADFAALTAVFVTGRRGQERERSRIDPRIDID